MAVSFVNLESPDVLRPIGPRFSALTSYKIIFESSDIHGAIGISISALPILFIILEISNIFMPKQFGFSAPGKGALTALHPVLESANVFASIGIGIVPLTGWLTIFKITDVCITGKYTIDAPGFSTLPSFHIIFELTSIRAAIGICICALAVLLIVFKFPSIFMSSQCCLRTPSFGPLSGLHIVYKGSDVGSSISIGIGALPVLFILPKRPHVFMTG